MGVICSDGFVSIFLSHTNIHSDSLSSGIHTMQQGSACHQLSRWFLGQLILRPCKWRRYLPSKRLLTFSGLHHVLSQKTILFITTAVRISYPIIFVLFVIIFLKFEGLAKDSPLVHIKAVLCIRHGSYFHRVGTYIYI